MLISLYLLLITCGNGCGGDDKSCLLFLFNNEFIFNSVLIIEKTLMKKMNERRKDIHEKRKDINGRGSTLYLAGLVISGCGSLFV